MKYLLTFALFTFGLHLSAQQVQPLGKGWQLSFGLEGGPQRKSGTSRTAYVTAADTLPIAPGTSSFFSFRQTERVEAGNGDLITYYSEPGLDVSGRLVDAFTRLLGSVQLHRRTAINLEYSVGFGYEQYKVRHRLAPDPELPEDFLLLTNDRDVQRGGLRSSVVYNALPEKRLQPYAGLEIDLFISYSEYVRSLRQFPNQGVVEDLGVTVVERFRKNTLFDFDANFLVGANYRLSEKFALGVGIRLWRENLPSSGKLQLRYLFGQGAND